jgi:outer membrane protein LpxR
MRFSFAVLSAVFGLGFVSLAPPVTAQEDVIHEQLDLKRSVLGYGRLFTNDFLFDGQDRWRTGSYAFSQIRGYEGGDPRPSEFGEVLELRARTDILAPSNLVTPAAGDRRYAGIFSFEAYTYWQKASVEYSVGGGLAFVGPQTGLGSFQSNVHGWIDAGEPDLSNQIEDNVYPTATFEAARSYGLGDTTSVRPFVEAIAGPETLLRVGADMVVGRQGRDELFLRDSGTGQLYQGTRSEETGTSFVLGGDIAYVADSKYLDEADGYVLTDSRKRLRAGLRWQSEKTTVFYGLTWLSEEFEAQSEGQTVGSLKLQFKF